VSRHERAPPKAVKLPKKDKTSRGDLGSTALRLLGRHTALDAYGSQRKNVSVWIRPYVLTILGLAAEAAIVWGLLHALSTDTVYRLFPIFGALGGMVGGLLRNDNKLILCDASGPNSLTMGVVGDVAIGLGGAASVLFLFSGTLATGQKSLVVSVCFIAGVFGRRVLEAAGERLMNTVLQKARQQTTRLIESLEVEKTTAVAKTSAATQAIGTGDYDNALALTEAAIQCNAEYYPAYIEKGRALSRLGRPDEALKAVQQVLKLAPNHPGALYNRACYKCLVAPAAGPSEEELKDILSDLNRALDLSPKLAASAKQPDPDFEKIKNDPEFQKIVKKDRSHKVGP